MASRKRAAISPDPDGTPLCGTSANAPSVRPTSASRRTLFARSDSQPDRDTSVGTSGAPRGAERAEAAAEQPTPPQIVDLQGLAQVHDDVTQADNMDFRRHVCELQKTVLISAKISHPDGCAKCATALESESAWAMPSCGHLVLCESCCTLLRELGLGSDGSLSHWCKGCAAGTSL